MGNKMCTQTSLQQAQDTYSFSSLTFFHEISCSTCHKFVLSQQDWKMGPCKNKNSSNVNIQKYVESTIIIQAQIQTSN